MIRQFEANITAETLEDIVIAVNYIYEAAKNDGTGREVWEASAEINDNTSTATVKCKWTYDDGKPIETETSAIQAYRVQISRMIYVFLPNQ